MLFWPVRTVRDVLEIKRNDPDYADLMDSVRHHGIGFPILIYGRSVHNGHHRIAAALDLGIEEIPWCNDSSIGWEEDWPDDSVLDCGA
jgi:ParB-like chromosome segregation protein Spo0J